jgi:hypothetical protein
LQPREIRVLNFTAEPKDWSRLRTLQARSPETLKAKPASTPVKDHAILGAWEYRHGAASYTRTFSTNGACTLRQGKVVNWERPFRVDGPGQVTVEGGLTHKLRPDGTLDDEVKILDAMAGWIAVNGEAIYGTRPWKVFGEGPTKLGKGRHGGLNDTGNYKPSDIRFTTKGGLLYAIALGSPENGVLVVRSLPVSAGKIAEVALLGHSGKLDWRQTDEGLLVKMPAQKPCDLAYALKITAAELNPAPVVYDGSITARADGRFVLPAAEAALHGATPQYEHTATKDQIGCWAKAEDFVSWTIKLPKPGAFAVEVTYSCAAPGSAFTVEAGGQALTGRSLSTGSWADYRTDKLGALKLDKPGTITLAVKPGNDPKWKVIGLKSVILTPME